MAQHAKFEMREGREAGEKEPSVFEKPRLPWDGKQDVREYARRERAAFVGRLLFRSAMVKNSEEADSAQAEDLKRAFEEKEVALEGLHGKKEALGKTREKLAKKFQDFREAEKTMGHSLKPFAGEKREVLYAALDHELNPQGQRAAEDLKPDEKEKFQQTLDEFDLRTSPEQRPAMHMATYLYLKQERVFEAEDQLNGTREQLSDRETQLAESEHASIFLLQETPGLGLYVRGALSNHSLTEMQKLREIHGALEQRGFFEGPSENGNRYTLDSLTANLEKYAQNGPKLRERIAAGQRALRTERESLVCAQELSESDRAIAEIPEEEGVERGQEILKRQDQVTEA